MARRDATRRRHPPHLARDGRAVSQIPVLIPGATKKYGGKYGSHRRHRRSEFRGRRPRNSGRPNLTRRSQRRSHAPHVLTKTGVITVATSKYGRKYGWRHRAQGREFRGTWPRNSSDQNLISWRSHEIRWFDDHNT